VDSPAYNAFKHGLALQAGDELVALLRKGEDPRQQEDAEPLLKAERDALIILRNESGPDGSRHWMRETRWLRLREKVAIIFVVHRWYIPAILSVGASRYLGEPLEDFELPVWGPAESLRHLKPGMFQVTQFLHTL
jgi:hypothetical protein